MYDIIYIGKNNEYSKRAFSKLKNRFPLAKSVFEDDTHRAFNLAQKKIFTKMFWIVWDDLTIEQDFNFDYTVPEWDMPYVHTFLNGENYNGIVLFPKNKEVSSKELNYRFFINSKKIDIIASKNKTYDIFYIDTYEDYLAAIKQSTTAMTWLVPKEVKPTPEFKFDLAFDYASGELELNHVFKNGDAFNGIMLLPTSTILSKREIEYRFPIQRKEYDIIASYNRGYDIFYIDTYEDYLAAIKQSTTAMTWLVPKEVIPLSDFKFDLLFGNPFDTDNGEVELNHVFKNKDKDDINYKGLMLVPTGLKLSRREIEYRFPIQRKEYDIVATRHRPYDVVFISYNESNAYQNWSKLKELVPRAKHIHGVKGIHQAHIAASKSVETPMFFVVDGDAIVEDTFDFELLLPDYDEDITHVWKSRNPINGLEYGYGGIKLLPTDLTRNMDTSSTDMTMSISSKFRLVDSVSNITAFNTDAFTTWRSAFRECCKLAVMNNEESLARLYFWCQLNEHIPYGAYAYMGAIQGKQYGQKNAANLAALSLINDFDWLQDQFNQQR